ncbi:MAG TPA: hypothetical protein VGN12_00125 [Pirellulales bacterium]|jgi:hypothetical protein
MLPRTRRTVQCLLVLFSVALGGAPLIVSFHDPAKVGVVVYSAWGLSQASLLGIWVVLGNSPIPIRAGASALAIGWTVFGWTTTHEYHFVRAVIASGMLFAMPAIACASGALMLRRAGLQILVRPVEGAGGWLLWKISIKGLFLLILLIAIILAALRSLPKDLNGDELAAFCVVCVAEVFLSLWLCLGREVGRRLFVAAPLMAIVALPLYVFEGWIVVAVMGMTALFMVGTLLVIRFCGYRIAVTGSPKVADRTVLQNPITGEALLL